MLRRAWLVALFLAALFLNPPVSHAETVALNAPCSQLGATHMADNNSGVLACLPYYASSASGASLDCNTGGGCVWKRMSGNDSACFTHYGATCPSGTQQTAVLGDFGACAYKTGTSVGAYFVPPGVFTSSSAPGFTMSGVMECMPTIGSGSFTNNDVGFHKLGTARLCCTN